MKMTNLLKKSIPLIALVFLSFTAFSQDVTVEGQVTDAETGEPLPGVSIVQKGTQTGTSSDMEGNYQITVPEDATLVFSFPAGSFFQRHPPKRSCNLWFPTESVGNY